MPAVQLRELFGFLEQQMGLASDWLASSPCWALLYVTPAKRIKACVLVESISQAYPLQPSLPAAPLQQLGSAGSGAGGSPWRGAATAGGGSPTGTPGVPGDCSAGAESGDAAQPPISKADGPAVPEVQRSALPGACEQPLPPAGRAAAASADRPALLVDRTAPVRAVCGVRLMWVSLEARRQGLATRLLDCARAHFVPGYVVPRNLLAFTQPTQQGQAFAEAYTGTRRLLVYEPVAL